MHVYILKTEHNTLKRLHRLLITSFIKPLIATFFVAQFILILQFLWRVIDDLAGKGLEWNIIAELLLYASASLVPLALPLAVLLSSIMTFGNLGENLELTAIKSSGISLQKFMKPLIIMVSILSIAAFFYANYVIPYANLKALSLRYDIKNQRQELQIREGIFYNNIEGYSIKVGKKNPHTKLMKDIMIYEHSKEKGNAQITVADSGYIRMTKDESNLLVTLYHGYTYGEMQESEKSKGRKDEKEYPFQRREFDKETLLIDVSGFSFKRTDEGLFKDNYQMLKLSELEKNRDSLIRVYDKKAAELSGELNDKLFLHEKDERYARRDTREPQNENSKRPPEDETQRNSKNKNPKKADADTDQSNLSPYINASDSAGPDNKHQYAYIYSARTEDTEDYVTRRFHTEKRYDNTGINSYSADSLNNPEINNNRSATDNETFYVDTFLDTLQTRHKLNIISHALSNARNNSQKITDSKKIFENREKNINKHQIHWHKKFTLSFACLIFFFIGAPLGSIIRKGGLGAPLVVSVVFFIIYYIVDMTGENFVEKSVFPPIMGMWLSSLIFLSIGIFLTYKATHDSMILDTETYIKAIKKILPFLSAKNGGSKADETDDFHEQ